jgi:PRTRC genetic system protein C
MSPGFSVDEDLPTHSATMTRLAERRISNHASTFLAKRRQIKMSHLKAEALLREFHYNGIRIPDPGPELTVEQVRDLLTPNYPAIATASVSGPEATGTVLRYTFSRAIGTKG